MEEFKPGDVINGRFEITRTLGEGGMGLVVAAKKPGLDSLVAIKFLLPKFRDNAGVCARFAREARAADKLSGEHVARVQEVGTTPAGTPYFVMDHLTGQDLASLIKARGRLDVPEAVDLLLQACEGVALAHSHNIIHRDLKPANLFLAEGVGGARTVKVLDFGISKASLPDDDVKTAASDFFGSPPYMSPEQIGHPNEVDARSDVWALAVILYEMLAGVTPFTGETPMAIGASIMVGRYAVLSTLRTDIPAALDSLVAEALVTRVESRVPSVEAFAKRLAAFGTRAGEQSYERIAGIVATAGRPETAPVVAELDLLEKTADPFSPSLVGVSRTDVVLANGGAKSIEKELPTAEAPASPTKTSRARMPAFLGLAGIAIAGAYLGLSHTHAEVSASPSSSSVPVSTTAPSASATTSAAPIASADAPTPVAPSASASAAPVVLADPVATPNVPAPKASNECAQGATHACEVACAAHGPGRCEALAKALVKGNGAPKDVARAEKLYRAECEAGAGSACNALGNLYSAGVELPKDDRQAVTAYSRGCEHDDRQACANLGNMYFEGTGVPKNPAQGVHLYLQACPSSGPVEPNACLNLSIAYAQGLGAPKDPTQAVAYAKQACAGGAPVGCTRVSTAKLTGDGVPKDVAGALGELDGACSRNEASACKQLTTVYARGLGADVPVDEPRSLVYLEKACKAHDAYSCQLQDRVRANDTSETGVALSTGQIETSCNAGSLRDCGFLGERALAGQGMPVDRPRGLALLDKACKGKVARACQKLAEARQ